MKNHKEFLKEFDEFHKHLKKEYTSKANKATNLWGKDSLPIAIDLFKIFKLSETNGSTSTGGKK